MVFTLKFEVQLKERVIGYNIGYSHSQGKAQATLTESVGETGGKRKSMILNGVIRKEGCSGEITGSYLQKKWREHRLVKDNRHLRNLIFAGKVDLD